MFTVIISEKGGEQRRMDFDKPEVTIGRVQGNDIVLHGDLTRAGTGEL